MTIAGREPWETEAYVLAGMTHEVRILLLLLEKKLEKPTNLRLEIGAEASKVREVGETLKNLSLIEIRKHSRGRQQSHDWILTVKGERLARALADLSKLVRDIGLLATPCPGKLGVHGRFELRREHSPL